jgi:hypothetical protein
MVDKKISFLFFTKALTKSYYTNKRKNKYNIQNFDMNLKIIKTLA